MPNKTARKAPKYLSPVLPYTVSVCLYTEATCPNTVKYRNVFWRFCILIDNKQIAWTNNNRNKCFYLANKYFITKLHSEFRNAFELVYIHIHRINCVPKKADKILKYIVCFIKNTIRLCFQCRSRRRAILLKYLFFFSRSDFLKEISRTYQIFQEA